MERIRHSIDDDEKLTGKSGSSIIGYAPGAYDLFHIGHLNLLRNAKQLCDYLIAGVVSDEMLLLTKGICPVVPLPERLEIVRHVRCVDEAVVETVPDKVEMWKQLNFNVLFKGDDWKGTEKGDRLEKSFAELGVKIVYFPYTHYTSSSMLRTSLAKLNGIKPGNAAGNIPPAKRRVEKKISFYEATSLSVLKPRFQKALRPLTEILAKKGITANQVTVSGIIGSVIVSGSLMNYSHHARIFYLLPVWLTVRMGLNTIDGLLAIEHGQKSRLGGILNEGGDILSDFLLALPFVFLVQARYTFFFLIALSVLSESAGIAALPFGGERCNFGPFGKTDRAIAFGCIALWLAGYGKLPALMNYLALLFICLHMITIINRIRHLFEIDLQKQINIASFYRRFVKKNLE